MDVDDVVLPVDVGGVEAESADVVRRWPGEYALRMTFYFGTRKRIVLLPRDRLPGADRGTLRFSFPPLDEPHEVVPGPDVVFVEVVTPDGGRSVVESNAAAAAVRVMPPEAPRPSGL